MKSKTSRQLIFLMLAFLGAAGITAVVAFGAMRDLVSSWNGSGGGFTPVSGDRATQAPGAAPLVPFDPNAPIQPAGYPTPAPWDGNERVTILVLGLDYRDWSDGDGLARTDTMIVLTLDPATGTAGMLSIPRDLWVSIPGFGPGKINTAYQIGEINRVPGGGPGLALETVRQLLGIDIQFYAQVDFNTFIAMIDEIGGVKIDVPEAIEVDPLGDAPPKMLEPGVQTLTGATALAYARARNTSGGDFDRASRQQLVILGVRDRILSFNLIPILIARSPALYDDIANGIRTNLTFDQAVKLGILAGQVSPENIERGVIGEPQVTFDWSPDGQFILIPIPDKIRLLRDDVFSPGGVASPITSNLTLAQRMVQEAARISVLNGTTVAGLAARTAEWLGDQGVAVTVTGNAGSLTLETTVIDYTGKPNTMQFLVEKLKISPARIFHSYDPQSNVDIEIVLGNDWAGSGVLP